MQEAGCSGNATEDPVGALAVQTTAPRLSGSCVDIVLLSDVVYGSNPGVWERLAETLVGLSLAGRTDRPSDMHSVPPRPRSTSTDVHPDLDLGGTLILQCETLRVEGVLYDQYWEVLGRAGFRWIRLHDRIDCDVEGPEVRAWAIWRDRQ